MTHAELHHPGFEPPPVWTAWPPAPPAGSEFHGICDPLDLEFSEYGRHARIPPGWYILPGVATGAISLAVLVALML